VTIPNALRFLFFLPLIFLLAVCKPPNPPLEGISTQVQPDSDKPGSGTDPSNDNSDPGTGIDPNDNGSEGDDPGDTQPEENPAITLSAAAASGSAYPLILAAGFDYETPDQSGGGHEGVPHIVQQYDTALQENVFAFVTHLNDDRNVTGDWTRQRVEIKVNHKNGSPGHDFCAWNGDEGGSFIYRWKFKLPEDFAVSTEFSHIHQIKNEGGDASQPIVALTARAMSGNSADTRMQLAYYAPGSSSPVNWVNAANSLAPYLGRWVQCEERISYSQDAALAAYSIEITGIADGRTLMKFTAPAGIVTWRDGNNYGRPKFGLYRRIFPGASPGDYIEPSAANAIGGLKDETVLFADFEVIRVQ